MTEDRIGDGQAAWKLREEAYDVVINATRQELCYKLGKSEMSQGLDTDDFVCTMETARARLHDVGDRTPPPNESTTLYSTAPLECKSVRSTSCTGTVNSGWRTLN